MTIEQFFDIYPWINMSAFARAIGIDRGLLQRCREGIQTPDDWVINRIQDYIDGVADKMKERPLIASGKADRSRKP